MSAADDDAKPEGSPASLVAGVLDEEQRRRETQADRDAPVTGDTELLPELEAEPRLLLVLGILALVQTLEMGAFAVVAPDFQAKFDASDAGIGAITAAFFACFVLSSIARGRSRRQAMTGALAAFWTAVVTATSFVGNAGAMFVARSGAGIGRSSASTVEHATAASRSFQLGGYVLGPLVAGTIVAFTDNETTGWRWVFAIVGLLGVPVTIAVLAARRTAVEEPVPDELPISLSVALRRLRRVKSLTWSLLGVAAVGFVLFGTPVFVNLHLVHEFGSSAWERGIFGSATMLVALVAAVGAAKRPPPARAALLVGALVAASGVLLAVGVAMSNVWVFGVFAAASFGCAGAAFATLPGMLTPVIPHRLRTQGNTLLRIYIFGFGAGLGALLTGLISADKDPQAALTTIALPLSILGGALVAFGGRFLPADRALAAEALREERDEAARLQRDADQIPILQVRNLDFSYGKVQVLFDVGFDVRKGESLALLGANGAGKSTLMRVVSGLGFPERGIVRFQGRAITYTDPELRARLGIVQLAGGKAVFPGLSIEQNLRMAGFRYGKNECETRATRVYEVFPVLGERRATRARDLSGGQQQMLALSMALMHDPEILLIDELSMGLAPVAVQELLAVVDRLRAEGVTMIIVEQSLNVAAAITDRCIYLEKGSVRFEGSASELAERDDLARAVFLGQGSAS